MHVTACNRNRNPLLSPKEKQGESFMKEWLKRNHSSEEYLRDVMIMCSTQILL